LNSAPSQSDHSTEAIRTLLSPRSIVFVGASTDFRKQSGQPARNVKAAGFRGQLSVVNRRGEAVADLPTYTSIPEVPGPVDIGFITVPAAQCPDTIRQLGAKGARAAVVAVGGFAETGSALGEKLSAELMNAAAESGVRVVGPVCNGIYNTTNRLALGYNAMHQRVLNVGRVGFVSHSGALAGPFITMLEQAGGGLSSFISAGSELDLGLSDFIRYFAQDKQTSVIALIVDHVGDGQKFIRAIRAARQAGKEIVALKLGNTTLGRAATLAHSSHLSGQKQVYESVFEAEGIRTVSSVECLAMASAILSAGRCRSRGGVVGTSSSGGGAIILADLLSEAGMNVPALAPETVSEIGSHLRFDAARIMNPYDLGLGGRKHYIDNVIRLARDPSAAVLIVFGTPVPQLQSAEEHAQLAIGAVAAAEACPDLPVIYLSPAPLFPDERRILESGRIPVAGSTLDAVAVARALLPVAPSMPVTAVAPARFAAPLPVGPLSEFRSKMLLADLGIRFPDEHRVDTLEQGLTAAARLGYPVVLKVSGQGIWHKTEHRLLELNISDPVTFRNAWAQLEERIRQLDNVTVDGHLVSSCMREGVEAYLGFVRDPEFGPVAILGPGGIHAELFGPAGMCHLPLPLERDRVKRAVASGVLGKLLTGYRGMEAHDAEAFVDLICAAGSAIAALGNTLTEVDLNPVRILPATRGAWPLDALCVFEDTAAVSP